MLERLLYFYISKVPRFHFGKWAKMEELARRVDKALTSDIKNFSTAVHAYLRAVYIPEKILCRLSWTTTITLYFQLRQRNVPNKIPLLVSKTNTKDEPVSWDYEGRNWYYWAHMLAKEYGWSLEQIGKLSVDDALAHIQEILVDEQLTREFQWTMTEIAYPYNASTKKSEFKPLPRPYFMWTKAPEIKKVKLLKKLQPIGVVQDKSGMKEYLDGKSSEPA